MGGRSPPMRGGCRGVVPPQGSRAKPSHARGVQGVVPPRIIGICRSPRSRCPPPCGRGTYHGLTSSTSPRPQNVKPQPPAKPQHPRPNPRPRRQSLPRPSQRHQHRAAAADAGLKGQHGLRAAFQLQPQGLNLNRDHKALTAQPVRGARSGPGFCGVLPSGSHPAMARCPLIEWCVVTVRAMRGLARLPLAGRGPIDRDFVFHVNSAANKPMQLSLS